MSLPQANADLHAAFAAKLESVGGSARSCLADNVPELVIEASRDFPGQGTIYTDGVTRLLPDLVLALQISGLDCVAARSIDDALACPLALSTGELAIAETGSVITAERMLEGRAPGMLSTTNIIFVPADRIVPSLDDAGIWLSENVSAQPYVSFITGPSRSADIERTLTIGVQGPRDVMVVFVE